MHIQTLSSGSDGNATLVRAGDATILVDAGLPMQELEARLEAARVGFRQIDHVFVTHGHLDHSRSAGRIARKHHATVHASEGLLVHRAIRRARRLSAITIDSPSRAEGPRGDQGLRLTPVRLPHDAHPTVAYRIEHDGRAAIVLTDMGRPADDVVRRLVGAHVIVIEFNHDVRMVEEGPYPEPLKRRILGGAGHLSNDEAGEVLARLVTSELHTVVLAHLSETNNTPELAVAAARRTLRDAGRDDVRVLVASQHEVGPNLAV